MRHARRAHRRRRQLTIPEDLAWKIDAGRESLEGERKQITVLFADVQGSMDLAEKLDPESWRELMNRFFQVLADAVHHADGTVDKFTGDGIMALFGAPIAREDHAQCACRAALEMIDGVAALAAEVSAEGIDLAVRIGINSGEVVVGSIGDEGEMEYTAIGHTVGLAQRMESLAEPGTAYLTASTAALAEGFFELTRTRRARGQGRERADQGLPAGGRRLRPRPSRRVAVARAVELRRTRGRGGRAPSGVRAIAGRCRRGDRRRRTRRCRQEPPVSGVRRPVPRPRHPRLRGAVRGPHAGDPARPRAADAPVPLRDRAPPTPTPRPRTRSCRELLALEADLGTAEDLELVYDFLGVRAPDAPEIPMKGDARNRRLRDLVRRLVQATNREPSVVLIEDLQWVDPASAVFLETLVEAVPGSGGLVVATFRPEFRAELDVGIPLPPDPPHDAAAGRPRGAPRASCSDPIAPSTACPS